MKYILSVFIALCLFTGIANADVSRFPYGLNNSPTKTGPFGSCVVMNPMSVHQYANDFDQLILTNWTDTSVGSGSSVIADGDGGVLTLVTGSTIGNGDMMEKIGASFTPEAGKGLWYETRFKLSSGSTNTHWQIGLSSSAVTSPLIGENTGSAIVFSGTSGSANIDFSLIKAGVKSTTSGITTLANDTYIVLSFYYNGKDEVTYFVNGVKFGTIGSTALSTYLPAVAMAPVFGLQTGNAVAKTLSMDYITAIKQR